MQQVLSETLLWMAGVIEDFGLAALDVRALLDWTKADLGSANTAVRNAATACLAAAHRQLGPGLATMLRPDVKPALMSQLEDSFAANPQTMASLGSAYSCHAECSVIRRYCLHLMW